MKEYMNYWIAAAICLMGTVMTALGGSVKWKWLLVSDANVLLILFIAAMLDMRRG